MKIIKRKDGRYQCNVHLGMADGVPVRKTVTGRTRQEVTEKAMKLKMKNTALLSKSDMRFGFWADAWLEKMNNISTPNWCRTLEMRMKVIKKRFGNEPIDKIEVVDLDRFISDLKRSNPKYPYRGSSPKTLKEYKSIIVRVFDFAIQNRVIDFNPARYITLPKAEIRQVRMPLTDEQVNYFKETPDNLQTAALIMIFCGLRKGEVCALTWRDIDFRTNTINIDKAIDTISQSIKSPKSQAGYRTVPMPSFLVDYLKSVKDNGIYVVTKNGKPFYSSGIWEKEWKKYIKKICEKYDVEFWTTAHCLRHTYATILYESGVDMLNAKELLGHEELETTLKIYTHLRSSFQLKQLPELETYLDKLDKKVVDID